MVLTTALISYKKSNVNYTDERACRYIRLGTGKRIKVNFPGVQEPLTSCEYTRDRSAVLRCYELHHRNDLNSFSHWRQPHCMVPYVQRRTTEKLSVLKQSSRITYGEMSRKQHATRNRVNVCGIRRTFVMKCVYLKKFGFASITAIAITLSTPVLSTFQPKTINGTAVCVVGQSLALSPFQGASTDSCFPSSVSCAFACQQIWK